MKHISNKCYRHITLTIRKDKPFNNQMVYFGYILEYQCPKSKVKCADGLQCVRQESICDGQEDCHDGMDEDKETCKGKYPS